MGEYKINIDITDEKFSKAFKDFYYHYCVDSIAITRHEADLSFFEKMSISEREIAKDIIRQNLDLRYSHIIEAAGHLKDEKALPILYDLADKCKDEFSRLLIIYQAIWRINGDIKYYDLLDELVDYQSTIMKQAHFHQTFDLPGEKCILALYKLLKDKDGMVASLALNGLNLYLTGENAFIFDEPKYDAKYYINNMDNLDLLKYLSEKKNASR